MTDFYNKRIKPKLSEVRISALSGASEEKIAEELGITLKTLNKYKRTYPEFCEAVSKKKSSDALVMEAFLKRACGYVAEEETTEVKGKKTESGDISDETVVKKMTKKDVPPDLGAIKWWLENNRAPDEGEDDISIEEARKILDEKRRKGI